jgi:hypothetical protein
LEERLTKPYANRLMKSYRRFTLAAAILITVLEVAALAGAEGIAQAAPISPCDLRLRVALTPDVPNASNAGFISSLLSNHLDYQLVLQGQDRGDSSVIVLNLTGPGPEAGCREVVNSMRRDARVVSVEVERNTVNTDEPVSMAQPRGALRAGPDGDWILEPASGVPYSQQAQDRYECDIWAVGQTGFDPTLDDGGAPPGGVTSKRADYLRAEAACFQGRGYALRQP